MLNETNTSADQSFVNDQSPSGGDAKCTQTRGTKTEKPSRKTSKLLNWSSSSYEGPRGRALVFTSSGGFDKIAVKEQPIPEPKENEIRMSVKFAGINFVDLMRKQNIYSRTETFPLVAGHEASGIIDAVGSDVHDFKVGDRVLAINSCGCFSDYVCLNQEHFTKLPDTVSLEDAACLFVNYVTAYDLIFNMANIKPNQILLLPQASGGVGNAVIQLLKSIPDVTIIALSSESKHEYLRSLGVRHCIDYRTQNYVTEVRKISPKGVDVVFDSLNGDDSVNAFNLLKPFGRVIHYGTANLSSEDRSLFRTVRSWWNCLSFNSLKIMSTNKLMGGYHLSYIMKDQPEIAMATLHKLIKMLENGEIKPKIDSVYPLTKGKEAMLRVVRRENIGKVLLSTTAQDEVILSESSAESSPTLQ